MTEANPSKPVTNLQWHGGTVVRPTYQPSRAESEEPIKLLQVSLEEACRKLMEPIRIDCIEESPHDS